MNAIIKNKWTLSKINEAIPNPTLAAVAAIAIVLSLIIISGVMEDPESLKRVFLIVQSKIHVGSVMNVDFSYRP
ncbi:MAG TPA: hypothetical protein EYG68_00015 [Leucothrix mucor]|nr:hypothetical protein [Leucothrix mucor]